MADPIGPFPTKAPGEWAYSVAKLSVGAVPTVGPIAQELLDKLVGDPLKRRQDAWFAEIGSVLARVAERVDGFSTETLAQDEAFVSVIAKTTQLALSTHSRNKREALRNIVANVAAGVRLDDILQGAFLANVERFSEAHLKLLALMEDPMTDPAYAAAADSFYMAASVLGALEQSHSELTANPEALSRIWSDLVRETLVNDSLQVMMTPQGIKSPQITDLGRAFLRFIRDPDV